MIVVHPSSRVHGPRRRYAAFIVINEHWCRKVINHPLAKSHDLGKVLTIANAKIMIQFAQQEDEIVFLEELGSSGNPIPPHECMFQEPRSVGSTPKLECIDIPRSSHALPRILDEHIAKASSHIMPSAKGDDLLQGRL